MKEYAISHAANNFLLNEDRHFLEALTRWNYFPNQKASASELPPNICTRQYTPEVADQLANRVKISRNRLRRGFDLVEYRSTRYNNVSRVLGLIHPLAYAQIYSQIKANIGAIKNAMCDPASAITVQSHNDGRMLIMNYEDQEIKAVAAAEKGFGKKFRAHTDIGNCFGSIYTHSLEWAAQGFDVAKERLGDKGEPRHWSSDLDRVLRAAKRNETAGLPIGPASSSIAVEIVLAAVDRGIAHRFNFVRYLDDYTALCDSHDEAQEFIRVLGSELGKYRLTLNLTKTSIVELPEPIQEGWVSELMNVVPSLLRSDGDLMPLSTGEAFHFMDYAVRLNNKTPDGSVVKFAVSMIAHRVEGKAAADVFGYVMNLAWHYPVLLPFLEKIDARSIYLDRQSLIEKLNAIVRVNAKHRRSDGMSWALYYLERLKAEPSIEAIEDVMGSRDAVSISLLANFPGAQGKVIEYAKIVATSGIYSRDQYWLLMYQLYLKGEIENPDVDDGTFELLKSMGVNFFSPPEIVSRAEAYCALICNPFDESEPPSFEEWMK